MHSNKNTIHSGHGLPVVNNSVTNSGGVVGGASQNPGEKNLASSSLPGTSHTSHHKSGSTSSQGPVKSLLDNTTTHDRTSRGSASGAPLAREGDIPSSTSRNISSGNNHLAHANDHASHRDRQHDTEVTEVFKPAVTKEVIIPVQKEEEVIALDREIHQDHYQSRIQPIEDHVHEAERHKTNVLPVVHREERHGKEAEIERKLRAEAEQFKSTTTILPTTHEKISAGTIAGEHIHHHVHEQIQPVIEREIIQPTVIHTTVPIHERVEHAPTFHPATVQPKMTMEEFKAAGGTLQGRPEVREVFAGEPQIKENGGANQTHPTPRGAAGLVDKLTHHHDRPEGVRRRSSSSERKRGGLLRRRSSSSDRSKVRT